MVKNLFDAQDVAEHCISLIRVIDQMVYEMNEIYPIPEDDVQKSLGEGYRRTIYRSIEDVIVRLQQIVDAETPRRKEGAL